MFGLDSVPVVASTPTTRERVREAAGLTAGSIATIGTSKRARSDSTAIAVAVLHATTTAFAPCSTRKSVMLVARSITNCGERSPYGAQPESPTYKKCSCGSS